jgi:hypothetical protein
VDWEYHSETKEEKVYKQAILGIMILLLCICPVFAARRALIIGNSAYSDKPLRNPVNDALLMQRTLDQVGFITTCKTDVNVVEFERAIIDFVQQINSNDEVLFYYSGHGVQIEGENYLLPVGEDFSDITSAKRRSIALSSDVMKRMERAKMQIIVLDACRDNPFTAYRSASRGLAQPPTSDTKEFFIMYATDANNVAEDGIGINSDFTRVLSEKILTPGLELTSVARNVLREVNGLNSNQRPDWKSRYMDEFYFLAPKPVSPPVVTPAPQAPVIQETPPQIVQPPAPVVQSPPPVTQQQTPPAPVAQPQTPPVQIQQPVIPVNPPAQTNQAPAPIVIQEETPQQLALLPTSKPPLSDPTQPKPVSPNIPLTQQKQAHRIRMLYGSKVEYSSLFINHKDSMAYDLYEKGSSNLAYSENYVAAKYRQLYLKAMFDNQIHGGIKFTDYDIIGMEMQLPLYIFNLKGAYNVVLDSDCGQFYLGLAKRFSLWGMHNSLSVNTGGSTANEYKYVRDFVHQESPGSYNMNSYLYEKEPMNTYGSTNDGWGLSFSAEFSNRKSANFTHGYMHNGIPQALLKDFDAGSFYLRLSRIEAYSSLDRRDVSVTYHGNAAYKGLEYSDYKYSFKGLLCIKPMPKMECQFSYSSGKDDVYNIVTMRNAVEYALFDIQGTDLDSRPKVFDLSASYCIPISNKITLIPDLGIEHTTDKYRKSTLIPIYYYGYVSLNWSYRYEGKFKTLALPFNLLIEYRPIPQLAIHAKARGVHVAKEFDAAGDSNVESFKRSDTLFGASVGLCFEY